MEMIPVGYVTRDSDCEEAQAFHQLTICRVAARKRQELHQDTYKILQLSFTELTFQQIKKQAGTELCQAQP